MNLHKTITPLLMFFLLLILSPTIPTPLMAQTGGPYDLTWNTFSDAGGGTSSGGTYSIRGTIGQIDAGSSSKTGSQFEHLNGFWVFLNTGVGDMYIYCYEDSNDVRVEWVPIPDVTLYDIYYNTTPDDPASFSVLDIDVTSPYYHVDGIIEIDDYYYDVRPAP